MKEVVSFELTLINRAQPYTGDEYYWGYPVSDPVQMQILYDYTGYQGGTLLKPVAPLERNAQYNITARLRDAGNYLREVTETFSVSAHLGSYGPDLFAYTLKDDIQMETTQFLYFSAPLQAIDDTKVSMMARIVINATSNEFFDMTVEVNASLYADGGYQDIDGDPSIVRLDIGWDQVFL